jgi:hypothetical protein
VPFLREDRRDAAEISQQQAATIRTLIEGGYEPDAAVRAVMAEDYGLLIGKHSGLVSVQLQPPGTTADEPALDEPAPAPTVEDGAPTAAGGTS